MRKLIIIIGLLFFVTGLTGCKDVETEIEELNIFNDIEFLLDIQPLEIEECDGCIEYENFDNFLDEFESKVEVQYKDLFTYTINFPYQEDEVTKENMVRDFDGGSAFFNYSPYSVIEELTRSITLVKLGIDCSIGTMEEGYCVFNSGFSIKVTGTSDAFSIHTIQTLNNDETKENLYVFDFTNGVEMYMLQDSPSKKTAMRYSNGFLVKLLYMSDDSTSSYYAGDFSTNEFVNVEVITDGISGNRNAIGYYNKALNEMVLQAKTDNISSLVVSIANDYERILSVNRFVMEGVGTIDDLTINANLFYYDGWTHIDTTSSSGLELYNNDMFLSNDVHEYAFNGFNTYLLSYDITDTDVRDNVNPINEDMGLTTSYNLDDVYDLYEEWFTKDNMFLANDVDYSLYLDMVSEWFAQLETE